MTQLHGPRSGDLGRGGATTFQQDLQNADWIVVQGSNMAECHPVGFRWVMEAKARGATIIHVDPRFTRTSAVASPGRRKLIGALGLLGTLAMRFGVVTAGRASARDPRATFEMQRAGRGAAEIAKERAHPMPAPPGVDVGGRESYAHDDGAASP